MTDAPTLPNAVARSAPTDAVSRAAAAADPDAAMVTNLGMRAYRRLECCCGCACRSRKEKTRPPKTGKVAALGAAGARPPLVLKPMLLAGPDTSKRRKRAE